MKLTSILYGALLATAATFANPIAEAQKHHFCYRPGEACSEARRALNELSSIHKRAALAGAEAMAVEERKHHFCWLPGEACSEAKRRSLPPKAIASVLADAEATHHFCHRSDQPCAKLKRAADAAAKAMAHPETIPDIDAGGAPHSFCFRSGEPCAKARRSALALAEAMPLAEPTHHFCYRPGEACSEAKRNALAAAEAEADAKHHFCWLPGEPCSEAKRDLGYDARVAQEYCDSMAGPCAATKRFAAAVVDAIAEPAVTTAVPAELEAEKRVSERCYAEGGICNVSKRAVEELGKVVEKM